MTLGEVIERAKQRGIELKRTQYGGFAYVQRGTIQLPIPLEIGLESEVPADYILMICDYWGLDRADFEQDPN